MSSKHKWITFGHAGGKKVRLDAESLVTTKLLVTANSGGGKSYLLRKLFELLGPLAQLLVLDLEGEFVTLREKLDLVIVGPAGEIPTDVRAAPLLVRRLMEKQLSAVIDLSELPWSQRKAFVRQFCQALVELPKTLWHPCYVGVDEAHQFCVEKGQGEAESTDAVLNLCTLGRKRGFCPILATQRISTLHKGAAAECNNKLIGRTTLENDLKRAAFELGVNAAAARDMLRELGSGEFYAFGPSIELPGVTKLQVDKVETTHAAAGKGKTLAPPKPSAAISDAVAELTDLPKQAEAEIKDLNAAKARIRELERQVKTTPKPSPQPAGSSVEDRHTIAQLRKALENAMKMINELATKAPDDVAVDAAAVRKAVEAATDQIVRLVQQNVTRRQAEFDRLKKNAGRLVGELQQLLGAANGHAATAHAPARPAPAHKSAKPTRQPAPAPDVDPSTLRPLKAGAKTIAMVLCQWHPRRLDRDTLRFYAGFAKGSGTFTDYLSQLRRHGMLDEDGYGTRATDRCFEWVGDVPPRPHTPEEYLKNAAGMSFVKAGALKIGQYLIDHRDEVVPRDQLREACGFESGSGTFTDYLSQMRKAGIAVDVEGGVQANPVMWE